MPPPRPFDLPSAKPRRRMALARRPRAARLRTRAGCRPRFGRRPAPGGRARPTRIRDIAAQFAQHQQARSVHAALDLAVIGDHHQIAGADLAAKIALDSHGLLEHQAPRDIDIAGRRRPASVPRPRPDRASAGWRSSAARQSPPRRRRRECIPGTRFGHSERRRIQALRAREKRGRLPRARRGPSRAVVRRSGRYLSHKDIADGSCSRAAD